MTVDERIEALPHGLELYAAEQAAMGREFSEQMSTFKDRMEALSHNLNCGLRNRWPPTAASAGPSGWACRKPAGCGALPPRDAEYHARMDRLTAAQERTEASLKAFIDSMRSGNGHPPGKSWSRLCFNSLLEADPRGQ